MIEMPPWYQDWTIRSRPGTGIRLPLWATQFSVRPLRGRQLVEAVAGQGAVRDGGDHIGAPGRRILGPATRADAAAPLVGEDHLVAGVVEGRRVPVGHVRIEHLRGPRRVLRIGDVQQDAVAAAGAARQSDLRIDGDVVALVGLGRVLAGDAGTAAAPQTGDAARGRVGEDARAVDDGGLSPDGPAAP